MKKYFITCKDGGVFCTPAADPIGAIAALAAKKEITRQKAASSVKEIVTFEDGKAVPVQLPKPEKDTPKKEAVTDGKPA